VFVVIFIACVCVCVFYNIHSLSQSIRFLAQHDLIDCIVTSAGGVEEDLIKCLAPTHVGSFEMNGRELRMKVCVLYCCINSP
jgi:hypothetical protein